MVVFLRTRQQEFTPAATYSGRAELFLFANFRREGRMYLSHSPASGVGLSSQAHSAWPNHPGTPEISGVIERLINRTVVPAALPGIQVRGLSA